jgi:hypothetical protein
MTISIDVVRLQHGGTKFQLPVCSCYLINIYSRRLVPKRRNGRMCVLFCSRNHRLWILCLPKAPSSKVDVGCSSVSDHSDYRPHCWIHAKRVICSIGLAETWRASLWARVEFNSRLPEDGDSSGYNLLVFSECIYNYPNLNLSSSSHILGFLLCSKNTEWDNP